LQWALASSRTSLPARAATAASLSAADDLRLRRRTLLRPPSASEAVPSVSEADVTPGGALRRRTLLRPACSPSVSVAVPSASEDDEPCRGD